MVMTVVMMMVNGKMLRNESFEFGIDGLKFDGFLEIYLGITEADNEEEDDGEVDSKREDVDEEPVS